jgi:S-adenosylmethionine-diacylglycerol 3-amino-3-carboxypropyl transferase
LIRPARRRLTVSERLDEALFQVLTSRNLIYNTCWEDPSLDCEALALGGEDVVLTITSAGCNALDYLLDGPARVIAVDINPRQTALLELKAAAIRSLEYDDVFALLGRGVHPHAARLYREHLRPQLSAFATEYWDQRISWFSPEAGPFFRHGLSGVFAQFVRVWMRTKPALRRGVHAMFEIKDLGAQREHYLTKVRPHLWTPFIKWVVRRQATMTLLGVPMPQHKLVQAQYPGGMAGFIEQVVDRLFTTVPAHDNYFYRLYAIGDYTEDCCPRYLTRQGVAELKGGLIDRIEMHTCSVTEYLDRDDCPEISRFVLLDHMDWMSSYYPDLLVEEWNAIHRRITDDGRVLLRSSHHEPPYLDVVHVGPHRTPLREWLSFRGDEARELHLRDRVHTYASFYIGDVRGVAGGNLPVGAREAVLAG